MLQKYSCTALSKHICGIAFFNIVVPLLTYLFAKKDLTVEEVNGLAIDVVFGGVDTVSLLFIFVTDNSQIVGSNFFQSTDPWKLHRFSALKVYM